MDIKKRKNYKLRKHAPIAQLGEHITFNDGVEGSIPSRCTNRYSALTMLPPIAVRR